jgi:hypothetical protein
MPAAVFHPILDQVLLGLRNAGRAQLARPAEALFLALAWTAAATIAWMVYLRLPG